MSPTAVSREIPTFHSLLGPNSTKPHITAPPCAIISVIIRTIPSNECPSDQRHIGKVPKITVFEVGILLAPSDADPNNNLTP